MYTGDFSCMYVCIKVSGPPELGVAMWVLWKSSHCSYPLSHLSNPIFFLFSNSKSKGHLGRIF